MYVSMTGFGSARTEKEWGTVTLDISSVNHRYQEISVRLPRELASFEPWMHQKLRGMFARGKVTARVEISWAASAAGVVNKEVLAAYYHEIASVRNSLGFERDVALESLVSLPGVIDATSRISSLGDEAEGILDDLVVRACASWNEMRRSEGSHLKVAVDEHIAELEHCTARISEMWGRAKDAAFEAMRARLTKALAAVGVSAPSDDRFAQEAAIIADRWDISEELARLASHVEKFRASADADGPSGRKLDFIVQEMNREVNTINSKSADADIRWVSVEAKSAIERAREQIQNLE